MVAAAIRRLLLALCGAITTATSAHALDLIGYVPDYRMGSSSYVNNQLSAQLAMLDEVRYFGITVTPSGGLTTTQTQLNHLATLVSKINALPEDRRPRLGITLGGADKSGGFPAVAASSALRTQLAQNIAALLDETGATGVDVDWEHPGEGAELTTRYPALLAAIKQELGAERRVYATVSPEKILPRSVFDGPAGIDGASIMTYDIGWWSSDPADPNLGQHSLPEYVEDAVDAWTNAAGASIPRTWVFGSKKSIDAPEAKLGVGAPFYGRGFNGTSGGTAVAYHDLVGGGATSDGNAYVYQGGNLWLPGPEMLAERIEYANVRGLQHVIFWELFHDLPPSDADSLLRVAYDANMAFAARHGDFNRDGSVDGLDLAVWRENYPMELGATPEHGDANGDGAIDGADLLIWQRNLSIAAAAAMIPEPPAQCLASIALLLFSVIRFGFLLGPSPKRDLTLLRADGTLQAVRV